MTESAAPFAGNGGNACVLEDYFSDYPPFKRCRRDDVPSSARPARTHERRSKACAVVVF